MKGGDSLDILTVEIHDWILGVVINLRRFLRFVF